MNWGLAWKIVDKALSLAIRLDEANERRKARDRSPGLTYQDVRHQQEQIASATKSRTPTVILRRRPPL